MKSLAAYSLIGALFLGLFTFINPVPAHSATGTLYLSPASKTVNVGAKFTVAIRVNSGVVNVNAVQANLSYPTGKLNFVSISVAGSAFEQQYQNTGGGGSVKIARATVTPVKGDKLIASVTFKAKKASTASISFASGTAVVKSSDSKELPTTKQGGTYTIKSSTGTKPPPDGTTTPPPTTTPPTTTTTTKTAKKDTTAPKVANIKVVNIGLEKATVTWKTNERADSVVEYGISKKLGMAVSSREMVQVHKLSLSSKILTEGTRFYYQVRSKDKAGNVAKSKLTSFKTKGYNAKIRVLDLSGKPVKDAKVTLVPDFDLTITDEFGFAVFTDIAPGKHSVNVEVDGQTAAETIVIERTKNPDQVQKFEIKIAALATTKGFQLPDLSTVIVIGILGVAAVVLFWLFKFRMFGLRKVGVGGPQKSAGRVQQSIKPETPGPQASKSDEPPNLAPDSLAPKEDPKKKLK